MFAHYLSTAIRHLRQHLGTTLINLACLTFGFVVYLIAWGRAEYLSNADRYHERADRTVVVTASFGPSVGSSGVGSRMIHRSVSTWLRGMSRVKLAT